MNAKDALFTLTTDDLRGVTDQPIEWFASPSACLEPYVLGYRGLIMPSHMSNAFTQVVAPSGLVAIYFGFGRPSLSEIHLPGSEHQQESNLPSHAIILPRNQQWGASVDSASDLVAVVFKEGMATPFLDVSLHELQMPWVDPQELWQASTINQLADIEPLSPLSRVTAIESILLSQLQQNRLKPDNLVLRAMSQIVTHNGRAELSVVSEQLGISPRQLRRKFQQHVGMSPKQLNRILRFCHASELALHHFPDLSLTTIAQEAGYFDQAHFTRESIEFTGQTPKQLALSDQAIEQQHSNNVFFFAFQAPTPYRNSVT